MEIKKENITLSVPLDELLEALTAYVAKESGYAIKKITAADLTQAINRKELNLKVAVKSKPIPGKIKQFPESFLKAIAGRKPAPLELIFAQVETETIQKMVSNAFNDLSDVMKKFLMDKYYDFDPVHMGQKRSTKELEGKYNYAESLQISYDGLGQLALHIFNQLQSEEVLRPRKAYGKEELLAMTLREVGFSTRTYNCLRAADLDPVEHLLNYPLEKLKHFRNFGELGVLEIKYFLRIHDLK